MDMTEWLEAKIADCSVAMEMLEAERRAYEECLARVEEVKPGPAPKKQAPKRPTKPRKGQIDWRTVFGACGADGRAFSADDLRRELEARGLSCQNLYERFSVYCKNGTLIKQGDGCYRLAAGEEANG